MEVEIDANGQEEIIQIEGVTDFETSWIMRLMEKIIRNEAHIKVKVECPYIEITIREGIENKEGKADE